MTLKTVTASNRTSQLESQSQTKTQHRKEKAIKAKAKDPKTATPATPEATQIKVASVEGSDEAKGKFVRFVANSKNIQFQVWLRNATIQKWNIQPKSILSIDPATIAIASHYKNGALVLDADGNETPSPVVYSYTADGVEYQYPYGRGMLDMGLKVTGCDNSEVRKVVAFNPL